MKIIKAKKMIREILIKHKIFDWDVYFSDCRIFGGGVFPTYKFIEFNKEYFLNNEKDACEDTVLHEIAHVIVETNFSTIKHNHDGIWQAKCVEIGAEPIEYMDDSDLFPKRVFPEGSSFILQNLFYQPQLPKSKTDMIWERR